MLTCTDSLVLGDFNVHIYYGTPEQLIREEETNWLPGNTDPSSPYESLASASPITSSEWKTHTTMSSDHLPILIGLQTIATSSPARHRTYFNLKKANWFGYRQEIDRQEVVPSDTIDGCLPSYPHNRHRDRLQPAETTTPHRVCGHRRQLPLIQCLMTHWYPRLPDRPCRPPSLDGWPAT